MIVVVSDLHLTDGISGTSVEPGAFLIFERLIGNLARHACHRGTEFRPLEDGMDIVLLGDILDLLRSSLWPQRRTLGERVPRPWERSDEIAPTVERVVDRILDRNAEGLRVLRGLAQEGAFFYENGQAFRIPVRITYFVGNHDWLLRLPGPAYDEIRGRVARTLGLANDPDCPFPHSAQEADAALSARLRRHRLVLRHGDIYDPFNFAGDRNQSAIGDGVVIEVLNRFPAGVREELDLAEDDALLVELREIENVRPFTLIPAWLLGVIRRFGLERTTSGEAVLHVWNRLGEELFALDFVRARDRSWEWDEVDRLELGFRFVKGFASGRIVRATVNQLLRLVADRHRKFARHALAEPEVAAGEARYVVYGHTHVHEVRPLAIRRTPAGEHRAATAAVAGASHGADALRQFYFNSGTWRPSYQQTLAHRDRLEFLGFNTMSVLTFYAGDERGGRGFEVWNGALERAP